MLWKLLWFGLHPKWRMIYYSFRMYSRRALCFSYSSLDFSMLEWSHCEIIMDDFLASMSSILNNLLVSTSFSQYCAAESAENWSAWVDSTVMKCRYRSWRIHLTFSYEMTLTFQREINETASELAASIRPAVHEGKELAAALVSQATFETMSHNLRINIYQIYRQLVIVPRENNFYIPLITNSIRQFRTSMYTCK